ncbi:endonuclease SmrB [secondary endosymbiont of Ctenarytaina eucalypti]|uniref:Ribosome rescue factor SmrB n=1 Tax=secondary endosymbiont of Ctenarytaina eucalypti TaxID=1199245 RepID=J3Z2K7_9ENTR|nr:endonuclease SmrB [secondary endosymbiont of Ctenarytaina eucalypti]AFP84419.1 hypothetical protein A359_00100 [secondary endosymbiont of Ctenarytaina eucalypti]
MKKKFILSEDDRLLFRQAVSGAQPLMKNRVRLSKRQHASSASLSRPLIQDQVTTTFYFSDEFQPLLQEESPPSYIRPDVNPYEVKKLRRGDYTPELFLDLHGLRQTAAKQALGALIVACQRARVYCAGVMHGHGKHILKQKTPLWLAQHPDVKGFHQAPKEFGGCAALLILVELVS